MSVADGRADISSIARAGTLSDAALRAIDGGAGEVITARHAVMRLGTADSLTNRKPQMAILTTIQFVCNLLSLLSSVLDLRHHCRLGTLHLPSKPLRCPPWTLR